MHKLLLSTKKELGYMHVCAYISIKSAVSAVRIGRTTITKELRRWSAILWDYSPYPLMADKERYRNANGFIDLLPVNSGHSRRGWGDCSGCHHSRWFQRDCLPKALCSSPRLSPRWRDSDILPFSLLYCNLLISVPIDRLRRTCDHRERCRADRR